MSLGGRNLARFAFLILAFSIGAVAQNRPAVTGAGFMNPAVFKVAPGEVLKVWVTNTKTLLPYAGGTPVRVQKATSVPLPTTLAGFSVRIVQGGRTYPAPIFSVEQVPVCAYTIQDPTPPETPDCWATSLMVQIPFEISTPPFIGPTPVTTTLIVSEGQTDSTAVAVTPVRDNIHVLTACDSQANFLQGGRKDECASIITHADGTLVTVGSPAKPGETVVIYAFGLGQTTPAVKSGEASPIPAPTLGPENSFLPRAVALVLDHSINAGSSRPYITPNASNNVVLPDFVGLTPGQVGLYQINVKLPNGPPHYDPLIPLGGCDYSASENIYGIIRSNLTITIAGSDSFDAAAMCIEPTSGSPVE